jgi:hypothetical protein
MRCLSFSILALGLALVLASQWTIHLWPLSLSSGSTAVSGPEADLILAHRLGLEECDSLGDDEILDTWYNLKRQPLCSSRGTSSGMLVSVELRDPHGELPFSIFSKTLLNHIHMSRFPSCTVLGSFVYRLSSAFHFYSHLCIHRQSDPYLLLGFLISQNRTLANTKFGGFCTFIRCSSLAIRARNWVND